MNDVLRRNETERAIIRLLKTEFQELQLRRSGFSLRGFARKVGVEAPVLSQVLSGKRKITRNLARRLLDGLRIGLAEQTALVESLPERQTRAKACSPSRKRATETVELDLSAFEVISDYWHFALLALADTAKAKTDPKWIAKTLGIPVREARKSKAILTDLGLLAEEGRRLLPTGKSFVTPTGIPSTAIKKNHLQGLDLARDALWNVPVDRREFGAVSFAAHPDQLPAIKRRMTEFRSDIAELCRNADKNTVYRFQMQLFPLNQTGDRP